MAASRSFSRRGGSGNRALLAAMPGRSAANETSRSPLPAIARKQTPTARLNGSVGASLDGAFGLEVEDMISTVVPGRAESANLEFIFTIIALQSHDRDYGRHFRGNDLTTARRSPRF